MDDDCGGCGVWAKCCIPDLESRLTVCREASPRGKIHQRLSIVRRLLAAVAILLLSACVSDVFGFPPAAPAAWAADSDYRLVQEPEDGYSAVIGLIGTANRSVRVTMYELTDPVAVKALVDAHLRGVDTRVILDAAFRGERSNAQTYRDLSAAGVNVKWAPNGVIYHQKTITVDDTTSAVGTGNLTPRYYATSRDAWVIDTNPVDVAAIGATFDSDFASRPTGRPPEATPAPNLVWSPDARATFLQHIDRAASSVEVTSEELKDRAVISALKKAAGRGVACRIVLTENPAWAKGVAEVSAAGCSVHQFPDNPSALYIHEKILMTDRNELIIGSHNLSTASLLENRELSLALDSATAPELIEAVARTFDSDYAAAR